MRDTGTEGCRRLELKLKLGLYGDTDIGVVKLVRSGADKTLKLATDRQRLPPLLVYSPSSTRLDDPRGGHLAVVDLAALLEDDGALLAGDGALKEEVARVPEHVTGVLLVGVEGAVGVSVIAAGGLTLRRCRCPCRRHRPRTGARTSPCQRRSLGPSRTPRSPTTGR